MNYTPAVYRATWQSETHIGGVISRRRYGSVTPIANRPEQSPRRGRQIPRYYLQLSSMASLFLRTARGLQYLLAERRTQAGLLQMVRTTECSWSARALQRPQATHVGVKDRAGFCSAPQQFCHTIRELFSAKGFVHNGKGACDDVTEGTLRSIIGQPGEKYRGQLRKAPLCLLY
jgi:hypothetical protein